MLSEMNNVTIVTIKLLISKTLEREVAAALYTRLQRDREIIIRSLTHMA